MMAVDGFISFLCDIYVQVNCWGMKQKGKLLFSYFFINLKIHRENRNEGLGRISFW